MSKYYKNANEKHLAGIMLYKRAIRNKETNEYESKWGTDYECTEVPDVVDINNAFFNGVNIIISTIKMNSAKRSSDKKPINMGFKVIALSVTNNNTYAKQYLKVSYITITTGKLETVKLYDDGTWEKVEVTE